MTISQQSRNDAHNTDDLFERWLISKGLTPDKSIDELKKMPLYDLAEYLKSADDDDLPIIKIALLEINDNINGQLDYGTALYHQTGKRSDSTWWVAAKRARASYARRIDLVQNEISRRKKIIINRRQKEIEKSFIDNSKLILDNDTFYLIMAAAKSSIGE